jgi:enterochelin esterase-like enzyme
MNRIRRVLAVGVYPLDRMSDYTLPGYDEYGQFVARELVPWIDAHYRTIPQASERAVMGSSLGGVVSFHIGWTYPEVFGQAACLSSTFGFRDDLFERLAAEPRRPTRFYLDSGWPSDNYEVTRSMRNQLIDKGWRDGVDCLYLAFPHARHNEQAWSARTHIPLQFLFGT